jgi:hypothetical protein
MYINVLYLPVVEIVIFETVDTQMWTAVRGNTYNRLKRSIRQKNVSLVRFLEIVLSLDERRCQGKRKRVTRCLRTHYDQKRG